MNERHMGKVILFILVLFSLSSASSAQENNEARKVQSRIVEFFEGLSALSEEKIKNTITTDFILLEDGEVWNMDSLTHAMAPMKNVAFTRKNTFDFYRTDIKDNVAWVSYDNIADITVNERPFRIRWLESAILVKSKDGWKIAQLHSTKIKL